MNKIIAATLLFMVAFSGTALSEELVIKLRSGNSVSIKYTGTIEDIAFQGDGDAIAGIVMQPAAAGAAPRQVERPRVEDASGAGEAADNKGTKKKGWLRFKWAEPKDE